MRRSAFIVVAVAALTFFAGLGRSAISDSDEAFYAEAAREMLESGDFLTPRYNYENRFQKPVFFYWCVAAAYAVGGVGETTARAPAALAGVGCALLAWFMGRRWFGHDAGLLAGLIISTCLGCAAIARLSLPDLPLAFFITASIVAGFVALSDRGRPGLGPLLLAAAAAGLGFLTKGPIGIALPALVLVPIIALERRWAIRPLHLTLVLAVFIAIALPWYTAMTAEHGTAYLHSFFVTDNLERFATSRFNYPRPAWFYLPIILQRAPAVERLHAAVDPGYVSISSAPHGSVSKHVPIARLGRAAPDALHDFRRQAAALHPADPAAAGNSAGGQHSGAARPAG